VVSVKVPLPWEREKERGLDLCNCRLPQQLRSRMAPHSIFLQQRRDLFAEPLHLFQHRVKLQQERRHANIEKRFETVRDLPWRTNKSGVRAAVRTDCAGAVRVRANHGDFTVNTRNQLLSTQGMQARM